MAAAEVVRARIETGLKTEATAVLAGMGLSISDAIRMLLIRVAADKAMPFDLRAPNPESQAAMRDIQEGKVTRFKSVADLMADLND